MKRLIIVVVFFLFLSFSGLCFTNNSGQNTHIQKPVNDTMIIATDGKSSVLEEIKCTTDTIAKQTKPQKLLGFDRNKIDGYINLFAMIFGFFAAIFAVFGYLYQKKASKTLKEMQPKRLPFLIFAIDLLPMLFSLHFHQFYQKYLNNVHPNNHITLY